MTFSVIRFGHIFSFVLNKLIEFRHTGLEMRM